MLILILIVSIVLQAFCLFELSLEFLTFVSSILAEFQVPFDLCESLVIKILYPWTQN